MAKAAKEKETKPGEPSKSAQAQIDLDQMTSVMEKVLLQGNLEKLSEEERIAYYYKICETVGLHPLTKPFAYINMPKSGLQLYATKSCTEQLANIYKISTTKVETKVVMDCFIYTMRATRKEDGRESDGTGAVSIANVAGEAFANAVMKAETKARRRAILAMCGLSMLDESEIETVAGATIAHQANSGLDQLSAKHGSGSAPALEHKPADVVNFDQQRPKETVAVARDGEVIQPGQIASEGKTIDLDTGEVKGSATGQSISQGGERRDPAQPESTAISAPQKTGGDGAPPTADPLKPPKAIMEAIADGKWMQWHTWALKTIPNLTDDQRAPFMTMHNKLIDACRSFGGRHWERLKSALSARGME